MRSISPNITEVNSIVSTRLITAADVGAWLNLSSGMITKQEDLINDLIDTATQIIANYTWLSLQRTTFIAFYDLPCNYFMSFLGGTASLSLMRSPIVKLEDITMIEYLNDSGVWEEFDRGSLASEGVYENVTEKKERRGWASVFFKTAVPFDNTRYNSYKVRISFIAGYTIPGETPLVSDLPAALKTALLKTVAFHYTERGDCGGECNLNGYPVPCSAKSIIDQYSISRTTLGGSYTPVSGGLGGGCGC